MAGPFGTPAQSKQVLPSPLLISHTSVISGGVAAAKQTSENKTSNFCKKKIDTKTEFHIKYLQKKILKYLKLNIPS